MEQYSNLVLLEVALITCLALVLVSHLFVSYEVCIEKTDDLSAVSGYFRPRAHHAFLATSLSAILCQEWLRPLRFLNAIVRQRAQDQQQGNTVRVQVLKEAIPSAYDASYVGMMAYVVIAMGDMFSMTFRKNDALQGFAASMVIQNPYSF
jgi:hypothetical protein